MYENCTLSTCCATPLHMQPCQHLHLQFQRQIMQVVSGSIHTTSAEVGNIQHRLNENYSCQALKGHCRSAQCVCVCVCTFTGRKERGAGLECLPEIDYRRLEADDDDFRVQGGLGKKQLLLRLHTIISKRICRVLDV